MLTFDADTRDILSAAYLGADFVRRPLENMEALAPAPGERILDLGCGPGMMTLELARAVGPTGDVVGVDQSPDMLSDARRRCADYPRIRLLEGRAGAVPVDDGSLDAAVSLQVFEYVPDVPEALRDLHRALRPGGRLVIGDMQFDTLSFATDAPDRMVRMCRSWDDHVHEANLPGLLPAMLRDAGFHLVDLRPMPFVATTLRHDSLPFIMLHLMRSHAVQNGHLEAAEADAWFDEQQERAATGRFFFSLTHFVAIALRR